MDDVVLQTLAELIPGGVRRGELRRGGRALRWVEAGSGTPAVVFDAGLAEPGSLAWAGVLPAVAAHTRVIAYDRAGVGASDPMSPLTLDGQIDDLTALLSEANAEPCVLAGHSWGGLLADLAALSRPDLVAGMVLVDPAHEETLAAVPWLLRGALSVPGYGALLLHSLGLLAPTLRRQYRPYAQRVTEDPRLQSLILDAYVSCFTKSTQVRMLRDENRLGTQAISRIRQIRAESARPGCLWSSTARPLGYPRAPRRWTSCGQPDRPRPPGAHTAAVNTPGPPPPKHPPHNAGTRFFAASLSFHPPPGGGAGRSPPPFFSLPPGPATPAPPGAAPPPAFRPPPRPVRSSRAAEGVHPSRDLGY